MYFEINRGDAGRSKATGGNTHVIWWTSVADAEPATQNAGPAVWGDFEAERLRGLALVERALLRIPLLAAPSTMQRRPHDNDWPAHMDYTKQLKEVPGTKKPGETRAPPSNPHLMTLGTELSSLSLGRARASGVDSRIQWRCVSSFSGIPVSPLLCPLTCPPPQLS